MEGFAGPPGNEVPHRQKPPSQSSVGSELPSWTTIAADSASDEEDALNTESQATTPEPETKDPTSTPSARERQDAPFVGTRLPLLWLPPSIATPRPTKRRKSSHTMPGEDSFPSAAPKSKKSRASVPAESSLNFPDTQNQDSAYSDLTVPLPTAANRDVDVLVSTASSAREPHVAPSNVTTRHLRPSRRAPPLHNDTLVDDALETHVASVRILPEFARDRASVAYLDLYHMMHSPPPRKADKGKSPANVGWTSPRWSIIGEFKERLDTFFGFEDIDIGSGQLPQKAVKQEAENDVPTAHDAASMDELAGRGGTPDFVTDTEDDVHGSAQEVQRGRLEKPSPAKVNRTSRPPRPSHNSPEII